MTAMRKALGAMCLLTLLAVAYLTVSLVVLRPPRANYPVWFTLASIFVAQGVLTLAGLRARPSPSLRYAVLAGGALLAAVGVWMVRATLASAHFEGYALVLGSMLIAQGALTLAVFLRATDTSRAFGT
jgi:uncharacterized membrane protein HdeD (DUF308 family)